MKNKILYILTLAVIAYLITFLVKGVPWWTHYLMFSASFLFMIWSYRDLIKGKVAPRENTSVEDMRPRTIEELEEISNRKK